MGFSGLLFAIALPVLGIAGAVAALRMQRKADEREAAPKWRDDSLDDWRKQREAEIEAERSERAAHPELLEGSSEEREEARRQQRIGG
jgi:hypothetical protein